MYLKHAVRLAIAQSLLLGAAEVAAQNGQVQIDEIVLTASPIRDSQAAAIEEKRNSVNVKDVISADTIGRFPDQNLADSLGRLPGVAIERDQGQARFINFRGAPTRWTSIAFDGIDVLGAENGRIPRFDAFPAVITRSIAASKAITPDMPGEAVAGFIDIKTYNPFEKDGLGASMEAGMGNQQLGDGDVEKINARLSWSNEQFGALVYGSKNLRQQITDNRELAIRLDNNGAVVPESIDLRNYKVEREDRAYGGSLEFRPGHESRVFISTLYSKFIDREERNQYVFDIADGDNPELGLSGSPVTGTSGYQPVIAVSRLLEDGIYTNATRTTTLGADFRLKQWHVETRLNYTETDNKTFLPIVQSVGAMAAASYDMRDLEDPVVNVFELASQNPANVNTLEYAADLGLMIDMGLQTGNWKLKLDAERDLDIAGLDSTLKLGVMADVRTADGGNLLAVGSIPASLDIQQFALGEAWDTDFTNTIGGEYWDNAGMRNAWEQAAGGFNNEYPSDSLVDIEEDIMVAYAMLSHNFEWGNVVYGARMEQTDFTTSGPDLGIAYADRYTSFLPSAHVNIDLTEDLKLRLSGSTGLSRPTYTELRASAIVSPTDRSVNGGNPFLDAETSMGLDASLEWYFAPASIISTAAFTRRVDDVLYVDTVKVDGGLYVPTDAGVLYDLSGTVNGKNGQVNGVELNVIAQAADFLPPAFDGFGVSFNATFMDSEFETLSGNKFAMPGTSERILNGSVYYEMAGFSARLNYMWRDKWLSTTESDSLAEYWDEQTRVDMSLRYTLPENWTGNSNVSLFANINNLTDEIDVRYAGTRATPNLLEGYGRYYAVGVRVDF